jgi:hypothetical protein
MAVMVDIDPHRRSHAHDARSTAVAGRYGTGVKPLADDDHCW